MPHHLDPVYQVLTIACAILCALAALAYLAALVGRAITGTDRAADERYRRETGGGDE